MKITKKAAKSLLENLLYTDEDNKLSKELILREYKPFVELSRNKNSDYVHVYRVLNLIKDNENLKPFRNNECTTKSIRACLQIATSMPSLLFGKDKMIELNSHFYSFKVPNDRILLDIDVILPYIKEVLKDNMENKILNKDGSRVQISKAIEMIKEEDEKEIIADLTGLTYQHTATPHYSINNATHGDLCHISRGFDSLYDENDFKDNYERFFKKILSKEDDQMIKNFLNRNNKQDIKTKKIKI